MEGLLTGWVHFVLFNIEAGLDLARKLVRLSEGLDKVLHVVRLTTNQAAKVKNNAASVVALSEDGHVGVLQSGKLLLIPLAFALELLGDLLLQDERFQSIITLLLGTSKTNR